MRRRPGGGIRSSARTSPDGGIDGVPGSHHPQYIDVAHREHAVVETGGVRTAKAMGCGTSKSWQVNWAGSSPRTSPPTSPPGPRLLGFCDCEDLREAEPDTLRPDLASPRPPRASRPPAGPEDQPRLAMGRSVPHLLAAALCPVGIRLTSTNHPANAKGGLFRRSEPVPARVCRAAPCARMQKPDRHQTRNRAAAQSVTKPQKP
jgi:hypothetical protein